jgi:hypothetical protein
MKKSNEHRAVLELVGKCKVTAWRAGELDKLLAAGHTLEEAMLIAGAHGHAVDEIEVYNLITTLGKGIVADLLIDAIGTGLTWHGIGTGTTAPALDDTELVTEVERNILSSRSRVDGVVSLLTFYSASECTYNIKEAGIFGTSSASAVADSGLLFSRYLISYDNSGGLVDLTFDYELTIG